MTAKLHVTVVRPDYQERNYDQSGTAVALPAHADRSDGRDREGERCGCARQSLGLWQLTAAAAPSKNYTVTKTFGPYNGAAKIGQLGSVPDGRALAVYCADRESVLGGTAKINRKTSYGTAKSDVLTLDVIGTFYDTDRSDFSLGWGAFANATGRSGWNSVTITVTCRRQ